MDNVPYEGGSKTPFWEGGVIREVFHPPPFSTPPMASSEECPGRGTSGNLILASPFCLFWGDFLGEMRMAKLDMLGRGGIFQGQKRYPKNFCDKDFAKLSGELSRAICLKTLVLMGNDR